MGKRRAESKAVKSQTKADRIDHLKQLSIGPVSPHKPHSKSIPTSSTNVLVMGPEHGTLHRPVLSLHFSTDLRPYD